MNQLTGLATAFFANLRTSSFDELANVTEMIRRIISLSDNPPVDELISTGLVPHIIKLIEYEYFQYEKLMNESAWILANIASAKSDNVNYLIQNGVAQKALNLLDHESEEVKDNAIWILANIAGDSYANRDALINMEIVAKLSNILDDHAYSPSFLGHVAWLMSNLCRGKPYPSFKKVNLFLEISVHYH